MWLRQLECRWRRAQEHIPVFHPLHIFENNVLLFWKFIMCLTSCPPHLLCAGRCADLFPLILQHVWWHCDGCVQCQVSLGGFWFSGSDQWVFFTLTPSRKAERWPAAPAVGTVFEDLSNEGSGWETSEETATLLLHQQRISSWLPPGEEAAG